MANVQTVHEGRRGTQARAAKKRYRATDKGRSTERRYHQRTRPRRLELKRQRWHLALERNRQINRERQRRLREVVIKEYGGKCECCGESAPEFLSIDHIFGGGKEHYRQENIRGGTGIYGWLKRNGFPRDRFRLLCHNCNMATDVYGACPHKMPVDPLFVRKKGARR